MAREKPTMDYGAMIRALRQEGPQRVYLLYGDEDYLRDSYLQELKKLCVDEGTEAFNYHRLPGAPFDAGALRESVEAMPFMGERTFTEVRDLDINRLNAADGDALKAILADVPEWATLAFVLSPGYSPDKRLATVKALRKACVEVEFLYPGAGELRSWVIRRAKSLDKDLDGPTADYLIWVCGERMNGLIPEITKIAGYAKGAAITRADIDAVAKKTPETAIYNLTDALGARQYDKAARMLADLLADRSTAPPQLIAALGSQFRQFYITRLSLDSGKGDAFITACLPELAGKPSFRFQMLRRAVSGYSADQLARAVSACVKCDYDMKNTGGDGETLLKELLLRLAMDRA